MPKCIKIEVLYPEFCNLYGDRGNIDYLAQKIELCGYETELINTRLKDEPAFLNQQVDMLYIGPCTERAQELILKRLREFKNEIISIIDKGTVILATGNGFELFGEGIEAVNGEILPALAFFPFTSKRFDGLRYNEITKGIFGSVPVCGFKNQLSHSYGNIKYPFLEITEGSGLNPKSNSEGLHVNNLFATYLLGPLLALNPPFSEEILKLLLKDDFKSIPLPFEDQSYMLRMLEKGKKK